MKQYNYNEMIKRINKGIYAFDNIYLSVLSIVGELDINSFNNINDENIFTMFIYNYLNTPCVRVVVMEL